MGNEVEGNINYFVVTNNLNNYLMNYLQMKKAILMIICIILVHSNVHPHLDPIITHAPKAYKVNIEDSPETRWAPIIKDY